MADELMVLTPWKFSAMVPAAGLQGAVQPGLELGHVLPCQVALGNQLDFFCGDFVQSHLPRVFPCFLWLCHRDEVYAIDAAGATVAARTGCSTDGQTGRAAARSSRAGNGLGPPVGIQSVFRRSTK